ncbi:MAG: right-handed parallel beta-helix repeat-containing protein [Flavobacteriales bacterium]|nr:right-handed parallel beta-helix repeat-containing protein [Flavobacteriales bacterium]
MKKNYMTLSTLLFAGLLFFSSAKAQYSGSYTVGGTAPDFASIQTAADALSNQGISGAVTLNIRDGIYNENVVQNFVSGVSNVNTITYQSESADSSAVKISVASGFNFYTDSVSYINFKNISFQNAASDTMLYMHDVKSVEFLQNNFVGALAYGVYVESGDVNVESINLNSNTFNTEYGFNLSSVNEVSAFELSGNKFNNTMHSLRIDCEGNLNLFTSQNDSVVSVNGSGIYIDAQLDIHNTTINNLYVSSFEDAVWIDSEYDVLNTTVNNSTLLSTADGLHIRGYAGKIGNTNVESTTITVGEDAFDLTSNEAIDSVTVNNSTLYSTSGSGAKIRGYYSGVTNIEVTNTKSYGADGYGMRLESDFLVENAYFYNDSIMSETSKGLYIDGDQKIENITVDHSHFWTDTMNASYALDLYNSDYILNNITITNSSFLGYGGIDLEGNTYSNNVLIDSCTVHATGSNAINTYFDDNVARNWTISNSSFRSDHSSGIRLYGSDAAFHNFHIFNCDVWANSKALYLDSDDDIHNCSVRNSTLTSKNSYVLDVETYDGGLRNFVLDSTICTRLLPGKVAEIESNYLVGDSIWVTNSSFICDSISDNTYGEALDLESDYGDWLNVWVQNNTFKGYDGIKVEADYGGTHNVWIEHNDIIAHNRGVYVDGIGTDCHIQYNTISPNNDTLAKGIEIRGSEGISEGFYIEHNTISSIDQYGIYLNRGHNYYVRNNTLMAPKATGNAQLFYAYNVKKYMEVVANKLYSEHEMYGVHLSNCNFIDADGLIANNFISGTDYSVLIENSSKVNVIHNSTSSPSNIAALRLSYVNEVDAYNNIFSINNGGAGTVYDFWNAYTINLDYNVFEFDTIGNNFSSSDYITNGLAQWSSITGYDTHSFYADPAYVNDTTDLHTDCSGSVLVAGLPVSYVMSDVDGNARSTVPTIGADEILTNENVFASDVAWICDSPIELNAGASSGSVAYLWSTGETSQIIAVNDIGEYTVSVTDACGSYTDTIDVAFNPETVASANSSISFVTASFSNTSINADSYLWNFGDGTTSEAMNPTHVYATTGIYTVTLIAYGNCNNDTLVFEVTPAVVGVEEELEEVVNMVVYPNPVRDLLTVELGQVRGEQIAISIIDISGQILSHKILNATPEELVYTQDVGRLVAGVYFVKVTIDNNRAKIVKLIKS